MCLALLKRASVAYMIVGFMSPPPVIAICTGFEVTNSTGPDVVEDFITSSPYTEIVSYGLNCTATNVNNAPKWCAQGECGVTVSNETNVYANGTTIPLTLLQGSDLEAFVSPLVAMLPPQVVQSIKDRVQIPYHFTSPAGSYTECIQQGQSAYVGFTNFIYCYNGTLSGCASGDPFQDGDKIAVCSGMTYVTHEVLGRYAAVIAINSSATDAVPQQVAAMPLSLDAANNTTQTNSTANNSTQTNDADGHYGRTAFVSLSAAAVLLLQLWTY